ncbi:hypothetical protein BIV25_44915 [Streptomyces sp. MUSC 14]|nr:hypothetical protein BIV25_44915 [Streptomyces sp. MUSC 14]
MLCFSKAPERNVTVARFGAQHRNLPRTTRDSVKAMTDDADDPSLLRLGGSADNRSGNGTPTPPPGPIRPRRTVGRPPRRLHPHRPEATPPATPPADNGDKTGGLADTGAQVLTSAAIAAALLIADTALTWMRPCLPHGSRPGSV